MQTLVFNTKPEFDIWEALNREWLEEEHPDWPSEKIERHLKGGERLLCEIGAIRMEFEKEKNEVIERKVG